jgi:hypothetical protein
MLKLHQPCSIQALQPNAGPQNNRWIQTIHLISEFVAKGSCFTLGVWGWGGVRSTVLLRPQVFATVWALELAFSLCRCKDVSTNADKFTYPENLCGWLTAMSRVWNPCLNCQMCWASNRCRDPTQWWSVSSLKIESLFCSWLCVLPMSRHVLHSSKKRSWKFAICAVRGNSSIDWLIDTNQSCLFEQMIKLNNRWIEKHVIVIFIHFKKAMCFCHCFFSFKKKKSKAFFVDLKVNGEYDFNRRWYLTITIRKCVLRLFLLRASSSNEYWLIDTNQSIMFTVVFRLIFRKFQFLREN